MSDPMPLRRDQPQDGATQVTSVHSNKNQRWYLKLCRSASGTQDEQKLTFPSPQRLQLQLHFQREYQQRQELQKNCRQEWWQRKSASASPSPGYRTPSPASKFYAGTPVFYQNSKHHQPTPASVRPRAPQASKYYQPSVDGMRGVSSENRLEREMVDSEREKMIKAAQVIKHDAEKRIGQAKRDLAATSSDQENIQRMLIQLLKEQELAGKLKTPSQTYQTPAPVSGLSADLQYKLATLLQAYQPAPTQQLPAIYQRNWREQIATYHDMLREYRQGNFCQSYERAKRLLQLLLQKDATSAQVRLPPEMYPPHPQQQIVYQQQSNHIGNTGMQPFFRTPHPQEACRPRRDPRLNRSSQQYQTQAHDITPRLNQSSCQYSEQDITPEIIYQADVAVKPGVVRRNSTPRKHSEEKSPSPNENANQRMEEVKKQQSELRVKSGKNGRETYFQNPTETREKQIIGADTAESCTSAAVSEELEEKSKDPDNPSGPKGHLHDWEQLQQRSQCHRRGRRFRRPSEDAIPNDTKKPIGGRETGGKTSRATPRSKEEKRSPSGAYHRENVEETDIKVQENDHGEPASKLSTGTQSNAPQSSDQKKTEHQGENHLAKPPPSKTVSFQTATRTEDKAVTSEQNYANGTEIGTDVQVGMTENDSKQKLYESQEGQSVGVGDENKLTDRGPGDSHSLTDSQIKDRLETKMSLSAQSDLQEAVNKELHDHEKVMDNEEKKESRTDGKVTTRQGRDSIVNGPVSHSAAPEAFAGSVSCDVQREPSGDRKQQANGAVKETKTQSSQAPHSSRQSELTQPASERLKDKSRRQSTGEPRQAGNKLQPSPQSRAQTPSVRGQPSRYSQPPFRDQRNQRASRSQPSPRTVRQSPQGSHQSTVNSHTASVTRPPSRNSQPQAQHSQNGTKSENAEGKAAEGTVPKSRSSENIMAKSGETKSPENATSRQGGRRSPGNTYVIRNSGQRLANKPPSGPQIEKPPSTRSPGANSSRLKNSSPKSSASKSPPDVANKTQISPPSPKSRRRIRRKPWDRNDETDLHKEKAGVETEPQGQSRFRDRNSDHAQQSSWHSASPRRWMGPRYDKWGSQPRRRPYQWDDSKTGPARKWRAVGEQGGTLPAKVSPSREQQSGVEIQKEKLGGATESHKAAFETEQNTSGIDLQTDLKRQAELRENAVMTEELKIVAKCEENVHLDSYKETSTADINAVCTIRRQEVTDSEGATSDIFSQDESQRIKSATDQKQEKQTKQQNHADKSQDLTEPTGTVHQDSVAEDKTQDASEPNSQTPHHTHSRETGNQTEVTGNRDEAGDHVRKKISLETQDGDEDKNQPGVGNGPVSENSIQPKNEEAPDSPETGNEEAPDSPETGNEEAPDSPETGNEEAPDSPETGNEEAPDSLETGKEESIDAQTGLNTSKVQHLDDQDRRHGQLKVDTQTSHKVAAEEIPEEHSKDPLETQRLPTDPDREMQSRTELNAGGKPLIQSDLRDDKSEPGFQNIGKDTPETQTLSQYFQEETLNTKPQTGQEVTPEVWMKHQPGKEESQELQTNPQEVQVEKQETLLEHVLAVLESTTETLVMNYPAYTEQFSHHMTQDLHPDARKKSIIPPDEGLETRPKACGRKQIVDSAGKKAAREAEEMRAGDDHEDETLHSPISDHLLKAQDPMGKSTNVSPLTSSTLGEEASREQMLHSEVNSMTGSAADVLDNETKPCCEVSSETVESTSRLPEVTENDTVNEHIPGVDSPSTSSSHSAKILLLEEMEDWQSLGVVDGDLGEADADQSEPPQQALDQHEEKVKEDDEFAVPQISSEHQNIITPDNSPGVSEETEQQEEPCEISQCPYQRGEGTAVSDCCGQFEQTEHEQRDSGESFEHVHASEENPMSITPQENHQGGSEEKEKPCEMSQQESFTKQDQSLSTTDHQPVLEDDSSKTTEKFGCNLHEAKEKPEKLTSEDIFEDEIYKPGQAQKTESTDMNSEKVSGLKAESDTTCTDGTPSGNTPLKSDEVNCQTISRIIKSESVTENGQLGKNETPLEWVEGLEHDEQSYADTDTAPIPDEEKLICVGTKQTPESCLQNDPEPPAAHESEVCQLKQDKKHSLGDKPVDHVPSGDGDSTVTVHADDHHKTSETKEIDTTYQDAETNEFKNIIQGDMQTHDPGSSANCFDLGKTMFNGRMLNTEATDDEHILTRNKCVMTEQPDLRSSEVALQNTTYQTVKESCSYQKVAKVLPLSTLAECVAQKVHSVDSLHGGQYVTESGKLENFPDSNEAKSTHNLPEISQKDHSTKFQVLGTSITDSLENNLSDCETVRTAGIQVSFEKSHLTDRTESPVSSSKKKSVSFAEPLDSHHKSTAMSLLDIPRGEAADFQQVAEIVKTKLKSPPAKVMPAFWEDLAFEMSETSEIPTAAEVCSNCGRPKSTAGQYHSSGREMATGKILDKLTAFGYL